MRYGEKEKIEQHILSTLPESECQLINLTANAGNIHWEETGEVFILNGVMYDVTKKKNIGGNIFAYCITEEREMEMVADCSLKLKSAGNGAAYINLTFTSEYILQKNKSTIKTPLPHSLPLTFLYTIPLAQGIKQIILPPPRISVS